MKFNKKKTVVTALILAAFALVSTSTLAWFSAQDYVKNDFFVTDSTETNPDKIFSIDVWEQRDTNGDGDFNEEGDKEYANTLTYKDILPGDTLSKIAHVKNTGYHSQYVRVTVTISDASAWLDTESSISMADVFAGFDASKWTDTSKKQDGDKITYVLYYNGILESNADITVFTGVNIPEGLTQAQAASFNGAFTIDVLAEAVQTENVGNSAKEAFQTVGM